tara:strand:- start:391 stop:594 length:204 start_codon:yes stop_codon:yes gene_type:complete
MYENASKVYVETLKRASAKNMEKPIKKSSGLLSRGNQKVVDKETMEPLDIVVDYVNMIKRVKSSEDN